MNKKTKPITHDEWIRELLPHAVDRPPNSFIIEEAMRATKFKRTSTMGNINEKVKSGELIKHTCVINGRVAHVFSPSK